MVLLPLLQDCFSHNILISDYKFGYWIMINWWMVVPLFQFFLVHVKCKTGINWMCKCVMKFPFESFFRVVFSKLKCMSENSCILDWHAQQGSFTEFTNRLCLPLMLFSLRLLMVLPFKVITEGIPLLLSYLI